GKHAFKKSKSNSPTLPKELFEESMQMAARKAAALYLTIVDVVIGA
ncbi:MAG: hypothetical protein GY874_11570, partial [Desulfobacteraceae bacterium]|nr:hypothetical protein [Desulfobacteraceae bacterium]